MNAIMKHQAPTPLAMQMSENELIDVLQSSVYPGAKLGSIKMVINVCRASGKDPLKKPYHIVPMQVSTGKKNEKGYDQKEWRDVIMPGINDYRTDAARTGQHAGTSEPEFGPDVTEKLGGVEITYPKWCCVSVQRRLPSGEIVVFSAAEFWKENYATAGRDNDAPNAMWRKRPYAQLSKCFDEKTEVLTTHGFQRFGEVTGRILEVTDSGLSPCDSVPFAQAYSGEMIVADGTRLNFCVTPNHDMLTTTGKIEAGRLFDLATKDSRKFAIPRAPVTSMATEAVVSDVVLRLIGYFLADGSHTGYRQFRIAVSRQRKIESLREIALHQSESIKRDAGRVAVANGRKIVTNLDKAQFVYGFGLIEKFVSPEKTVDVGALLNLSQRQARVIVDALLEFDGSDNGSGVRRLSQRNESVLRSFEVAAVHAGYSISARASLPSDIGEASSVTVSDAAHFPVVRNLEGNTASLVKRLNVSGRVWCVTVPSGVIVVRRHGFSMLCGNCSEAQALRKGFPEVGSQPTADEMEGKEIDISAASVVPKSPTQITPRPEYTDGQLDADMAKMISAITSGKRTTAQIIANLESKYAVPESVKGRISAIPAEGVIDAEFVAAIEKENHEDR